MTSLMALTSNALAQAPGEPGPAGGPPAEGPPASAGAEGAPTERPRGEARSAYHEDHVRFRGGIRGEGGALIAPGAGEALPGLGVQGEMGVQVNDLVGIYAAPSLDILFGTLGGVSLGAAVLVDFTFDDTWQLGVGPDVDAFAALGSTPTSGSGAGGLLYGARLHFAGYPVVGDGEDGVRRKGLALGVDLRLLAGDVGFATVTTSGSGSGSVTDFVIAPIAFIGYEAF